MPLQRMLELYQHDLSHIWQQDLDEHGEYGYALDRFWDDEGCHAFIATVKGRYAGFALVDAATKVAASGHWMDQFFVVKKYRRSRVGRSLARQVFAALPGYWEVGQMAENYPAQAFWRAVIGGHTADRFQEHRLRGGAWEGVVQCFQS
jgi:predicted acetyltransferase